MDLLARLRGDPHWLRFVLRGIALAILAFPPVLIALLIGESKDVQSTITPEAATLIAMFGVAVGVCFAVAVCCRLFDKRSSFDMGFAATEKHWWKQVAVGAAAGCLGVCVMVLSLSTFGRLNFAGVMINQTSMPTVVAIIVVMLTFAFEVVAEEVLFRGYLLWNLMESVGAHVGNRKVAAATASTLSGFLWAAVVAILSPNVEQESPLSFVLIFGYGIFFALVAIWTRSLGPTLGLHFAWNCSENVLFSLVPEDGQTHSAVVASRVGLFHGSIHGATWITGGAFGPEGGVAGPIGIATALCVFSLWFRRFGQRRESIQDLATKEADYDEGVGLLGRNSNEESAY